MLVFARPEKDQAMRIDWDVPVPMNDGVVLRADVFRPDGDTPGPVLLSYGPYAKGRPFQDAHRLEWNKLVNDFPEVLNDSTSRYQVWEVVDPERWVPDGYVCVRVDSRGAGRSPGIMDFWSPRETEDLCVAIEWAGEQPWSNGRVGLAGISYFAMNQYGAAARQPRYLAAICPWEGASDWYREAYYHGGILSDFVRTWFARQVEQIQHGLPFGTPSPHTGERSTGPESVSPEALTANRIDLPNEVRAHPLFDDWHAARAVDWSRMTTPMLSAANWGGQGLHSRGNFEAFVAAPGPDKWLEVHGLAHWDEFYKDRGVRLQKRFFDHFLKGAANGWDRERRVQLLIRHADGGFVERQEDEWPIARTQWTTLHLDPSTGLLATERSGTEMTVAYDMLGDGVDFLTTPFIERTEITGPVALKLSASSTTDDMDVFAILRLFDADGEEVTLQGTLDPNTPIAQGWLRASHRELDTERSEPYRPYHSHLHHQPLEPGTIYQLDIEIWPTCIVIPAGYRLMLTVRGKDYEYPGELSDFATTFHQAHRGVGPFRHIDARDGSDARFAGRVTIHSGGEHDSHLLLPIIPA